MQSYFDETSKGILIRIKVLPRAKQTKIVCIHGDRLKIRLAAPPVDGKANSELIRFLRESLNLSQSQVTIIRGEKSQLKDVLCVGSSIEAVRNLVKSDGQVNMAEKCWL